MLRALLLFIAAGCVHTVTSTATPGTARIECIDCNQRAAIGLPVRVVASWVGSCTKSGYVSQLHEDKDTGKFSWEREEFSSTKECDEHRYQIDVECSSPCVVKSQASPDSPNIRLIAFYPQKPGPLHYAIRVHRKDEAPAAEITGDLFVRAPDALSSDEKTRAFDSDSKVAVFDGWTYRYVPPKRFEKDFPLRGERSSAHADESAPAPDQLENICWARAPGATEWQRCTGGIHDGDDLRLDLLATAGGQPVEREVSVESADGGAWTCYRSPIFGVGTFEGPTPGETCVRYGVPAAGLAIKLSSGPFTQEVNLGEARAAQPVVATAATTTSVVLDSRDAFDSRRGQIGDVLGLFEGEYLDIRDQKIVSGFVVIAATVSPTWGRLRVGLGDGEFADNKVHPVNQKRLFRATVGWEKQLCTRERHFCGGLAVDGGYSFYDPIEGFYAVPQAIVDVRGDGVMIRLGVGATSVLGTFKDPGQKTLENGLTVRLSFGFPHDF